MIKLSPRLLAIAGLVSNNSLADVATDHALLPIYLAQNGAIESAVATDISAACRERARIAVESAGLCGIIDIRQGDGLRPLLAGECKTLVIAGIGGMLAIDIIMSDLEKARSFTQLIVSPQRDAYITRKCLLDNRFAINNEVALIDSGKYYVSIDCAPSAQACENYSEAELAFGKHLLARGDAATNIYIKWEQARLKAAINAGGQKAHHALRQMALCEAALLDDPTTG